ncbi:MAG: M12 family metallo-peptidase [Ignavibacteria bacterium]
MKKAYKINLIFTAVFLCVIVFAFTAFNIEDNTSVLKPEVTTGKFKNSASELVNSRKNGSNFETVSLFKASIKDNSVITSSAVSRASFFSLDRTALAQLNRRKSQNITLNIPGENGNVELELSQVNFLPDDFKIITSSGKTIDYNRGLYYQGTIKGNPGSIAAISIFSNDIMGVVSTDEGNYNLGHLENDNSEFIYYNDRNLLKPFTFHCGVEDGYGEHYMTNNNNVTPQPHTSSTVNPVKMYYVCDYQMYLDKGSNTQSVVDFVTNVFNQENILYNNESLNLVMGPNIFVYNTTDPYRSFTTSQTAEILEAFGTATKNDLKGGNLAQLLSTRTPVQGAIAWVNVLCQSYEPGSQSGRYAFIELENTYNNVPVFSWSVEVMAHETGHNFGSSHTQACVWPVFNGGGIGAIDSCVAAEQGSCFANTRANNNGTIMSYCHLNGNINFNRGFGLLPGDTIRLRYSQALCIDNPINSSEAPLLFALKQNYPNPFNPSTSIRFALPQDGFVSLKVYDAAGREVASLINGQFYAIGEFSYNFDASSFNMASGVYFYKLNVNRDNNSVYSEIKKMVLVK